MIMHPCNLVGLKYIILDVCPTIKGISAYADRETGDIIDPLTTEDMTSAVPLIIKVNGMYYIFKKAQLPAMMIQPTLRHIDYLDAAGMPYKYIYTHVNHIITEKHKKQCIDRYTEYIQDILLAYDI